MLSVSLIPPCVAGNQFRALEEDEVLFLDSILEKQREEERLRKETEGEELKNFREYVSGFCDPQAASSASDLTQGGCSTGERSKASTYCD